MMKVSITGLDDLSVGDILFHPGDERTYHYRVREFQPDSERCVGLDHKRHTATVWDELGMFRLRTVQEMYKKYKEFKYDPNQAGDTEDDI